MLFTCEVETDIFFNNKVYAKHFFFIHDMQEYGNKVFFPFGVTNKQLFFLPISETNISLCQFKKQTTLSRTFVTPPYVVNGSPLMDF